AAQPDPVDVASQPALQLPALSVAVVAVPRFEPIDEQEPVDAGAVAHPVVQLGKRGRAVGVGQHRDRGARLRGGGSGPGGRRRFSGGVLRMVHLRMVHLRVVHLRVVDNRLGFLGRRYFLWVLMLMLLRQQRCARNPCQHGDNQRQEAKASARHSTTRTSRIIPASMWYSRWQWYAQRPRASARTR